MGGESKGERSLDDDDSIIACWAWSGGDLES